jgi:hypothetical protein
VLCRFQTKLSIYPPKSLTHSNDAELEFQSERAYPAVKYLTEVAHPTRFERVTFAFGGQRSIYAAKRRIALSTNPKNRMLRIPAAKTEMLKSS